MLHVAIIVLKANEPQGSYRGQAISKTLTKLPMRGSLFFIAASSISCFESQRSRRVSAQQITYGLSRDNREAMVARGTATIKSDGLEGRPLPVCRFDTLGPHRGLHTRIHRPSTYAVVVRPTSFSMCKYAGECQMNMSAKPITRRRRRAGDSLRAKRFHLGADELVVLSFPLATRQPIILTKAEREVVAGILEGSSTASIAARRSTSVKTVANQIAAVFDKLGVSSRAELAAQLHSEGAAEFMR